MQFWEISVKSLPVICNHTALHVVIVQPNLLPLPPRFSQPVALALPKSIHVSAHCYSSDRFTCLRVWQQPRSLPVSSSTVCLSITFHADLDWLWYTTGPAPAAAVFLLALLCFTWNQGGSSVTDWAWGVRRVCRLVDTELQFVTCFLWGCVRSRFGLVKGIVHQNENSLIPTMPMYGGVGDALSPQHTSGVSWVNFDKAESSTIEVNVKLHFRCNNKRKNTACLYNILLLWYHPSVHNLGTTTEVEELMIINGNSTYWVSLHFASILSVKSVKVQIHQSTVTLLKEIRQGKKHVRTDVF